MDYISWITWIILKNMMQNDKRKLQAITYSMLPSRDMNWIYELGAWKWNLGWNMKLVVVCTLSLQSRRMPKVIKERKSGRKPLASWGSPAFTEPTEGKGIKQIKSRKQASRIRWTERRGRKAFLLLVLTASCFESDHMRWDDAQSSRSHWNRGGGSKLEDERPTCWGWWNRRGRTWHHGVSRLVETHCFSNVVIWEKHLFSTVTTNYRFHCLKPNTSYSILVAI